MTTVEPTDVGVSCDDRAWMESRGERNAVDKPVSIYEVDLGSWMRVPEEGNRRLTPAELAPKLADYARRMNFTHVQLLSAAKAAPDDLLYLTRCLHHSYLGVIFELNDWQVGGASYSFEKYSIDGLCVSRAGSMIGFKYKWDAAWARETVDYFATDPLYRKSRHYQLTFREHSAFCENYVLALSHEITREASLIARMPGDDWRKFANLRLLYAWQYALPGKKLLFMGNEFGQWSPWNPDASLDWHLVDTRNFHGKLQNWVADLNHFYRAEPALHQTDANPQGFEWVDASDAEASTISFLRRDAFAREVVLAVFNFRPAPRYNCRVGVPRGGAWKEVLNSDAREYGGSGQGNLGGVEAAPFGWHGKTNSLTLTLPPLGAVFLKAAI